MNALSPILTNEEEAAALLARRLPGFREGRWELLSCGIEQSRRRLSRRVRGSAAPWLRVLWRLEVRDRSSGACGVQWMYGKAYSDGDSQAVWKGAHAAACARPRFGTPIEHLADLDLVIWALPNDPALTQLPAFLDPRAVATHLPAAVQPDDGTLPTVSVVRHEPEEHCTAHYRLSCGGQPRVVYGKCYVDSRWRLARDCQVLLWRQGQDDKSSFLVGRPLGSTRALKAVWQEEVIGTPLIERLVGAHGDAALAQLADALLRFQRSAAAQDCARLPEDAPLDLATKWRNKLVRADARFVTCADAVLHQLARTSPPSGQRVPVHGDCHPDQMLWCDGRIALFDFDNLVLGSPAQDLANFISQLLTREEKGHDWSTLSRCLFEHFRRRTPRPIDADDFEWHLRMALLRKAYSAFVRCRRGWQSRVMHALTLAHCGAALLQTARNP